MKIKVIRTSISILWSRPRQLVSGLSLWRPRFVPGSVHVEFVVDKVTLRIFLQALQFSLFNIIPLWFCNTHVPSGGWTIGPLVATVQKCSLTPSTWTWHKQQLQSLSWETQVVKKFPAFYGIKRFTIIFTWYLHWSLTWARWIHFTSSNPVPLRFIIILSFYSCLGFPSGHFRFGFPTKILNTSHLPKCATVPTQLILLELIILIFWLIVQNAWLLLPSATFWTNKLHLCQCWKFGRLLTKWNIHTTLTTWIQTFKI
jgi:hypothetical protein